MNVDNSSTASSSSTKKMVLFAFPRIGSSLLLGVIGFALLTLYTTGYGLNDSSVAFIISGGFVAIAISQFFFGWVSDVTYSKKHGGRKPYVYIMAPLLVISFIFLLMPSLVIKNPSESTLYIWLIIWNTSFQICYAVTTPYQAWMAEQFANEERAKCSQIQNIFNFIGQAAQTIFSMVVLTKFTSDLETNPDYIPPLFFWILIVFGAIFVGSFYISTYLMPVEDPPTGKPNLRENLRDVFQNRNYLMVTLMQGIASIAWVIVSTVMLKFLTDVLGLNTTQFIILAGSLIIGMVVFLSIWRKVIEKRGKHKSVTLVFLAGAAFFPISLLGLINFGDSIFKIIYAVVFILIIAGVLGGWYLFPYMMYADLAEDDQRRTNRPKAGVYAGFPSILLNLFQALGTFILALFLDLPKFTVNSQNVSYGMVIWGPFCTLILIGAIFFTKRFVRLDFEWEKQQKPTLSE